MNFRNIFHSSICNKSNKLSDWYCTKWKSLNTPIYSSYDIRDAGFKISNVDANIFPAGFNNICPTDKEAAGSIMGQYLEKKYGSKVRNVLLLTEEHTNNPFYWDNVLAIKNLIEFAGKQVLVAIPKQFSGSATVKSASGVEVPVVSGFLNSSTVIEFKPDLIISNNDFSEAHEEWGKLVNIPVNPPRELGWYQRKKSRYFDNYNSLVEEFTKLVDVDPFQLNVKTELFSYFDLEDPSHAQELADKVDNMISSLKFEYKKRGIEQDPFVFVKNNAGTYGLAVVRVGAGSEILEWNSKARKKMQAAKGGRQVQEVIIQEGIPSRVQAEGASAEPVIYMIGSELAGGFLRTHSEKGSTDSLNSPGAVFKKLCVSDLNVSLQGSPLENVYGWSARIGLLAIGLEAQQMGVKSSV